MARATDNCEHGIREGACDECLVPEPKPYHKVAHDKAIAAGCKPFWHDGIFGWAWHCGCDEPNTHYIDQQCSVIKFYKQQWPAVRREL